MARPDGEPSAAVDVGDGPAVAVLDPVSGRERDASIVRAGGDHIADTGLVSVPQTHLWPGCGTVQTMITGSAVELSDELARGGEHDRVESGRSILNPSGEGILGDLGEITDMNTALIEIEAECAGIAVPQGERGLCFGRVGEAVQLCETQRAVALLDVAEHAAGADRGELLIITDQSDTRPAVDGEPDGGVEGQSVGHAGLVDDDQRRRSDPVAQSGSPLLRSDQVSLAKVSVRMPVCSPSTAAAAAGWGEADDVAAVFGPREGEGAHGRGLPGAGGAIASCRRHQMCTSAGPGPLARGPGRCRSRPFPARQDPRRCGR